MSSRRFMLAAAAATTALLVSAPTPAQASGNSAVVKLAAGPYDRDLRITTPDANTPFMVFAGVQDLAQPGPFGLRIAPLAILGSGLTDLQGRALLPIDMMDTAHAGLKIHFQALAAPVHHETGDVVMMSEPITLTARAAEVAAPTRDREDRVRVFGTQAPEYAEARLIYVDGFFPSLQVEIEVQVPTGGYHIYAPTVRWNEDFARIDVKVKRPAPDDIVTDALEVLRVYADLGSHADQVDVAIRIIGDEPPVSWK